MTFRIYLLCTALWLSLPTVSYAQLVINEGSNKNFNTLTDEDGDHPDWIEIYNSGNQPINLAGYSLSDREDLPGKWPMPDITLEAQAFMVIYCSGKNRFATPAFTQVENTGVFEPVTGWNEHLFDTPFYWDGISNVLINICSYRSAGYITNSVFRQSQTGFESTRFYFEDGSPAACSHNTAYTTQVRPNMLINGFQVGTGNIQNSPTDYPAPYGNWYYGARHQFLLRSEELLAAGITEGLIESIAFDVVATDPVTYDYIDFSINHFNGANLDPYFLPVGGYGNHTNFKIDGSGETVYLFSPASELISSLEIEGELYNVSNGSFPDAAQNIVSFRPPTPGASNNNSVPYTSYALKPTFTASAGVYALPFTVSINDPNGAGSQIRYTLDGSEPDENDQLYNGSPIQISNTTILKARAFVPGLLPGSVKAATYLMNISHATPIISVTTDEFHLYGSTGMFDNPGQDWLKPAYIEYFAGTENHPLVFSQNAGIIMDGGAGGSRWNPQRSFRIELANSVLGEGPIEHLVIPDREDRTQYSDLYLRNGSNQYLILPYKDAAQVKILGNNTNTYYSAWRPATVYVNGEYFGLYELREKLNAEYFSLTDGADDSDMEILSLSYYYGSILRAIRGDVNNYWASRDNYLSLNTGSADFWELADQFYDLDYYMDYIIGQVWMGNTDWPQNNIRIYRSDQTDYRWRFATIDQELALAPNAWTDCYYDALGRLMDIGGGNPFSDIWYRGLENSRFRHYFINRFADLMNTSFLPDTLLAIENDMYAQTVVEMANEYERWGDPGNIPGQMSDFYNNHLIFQSELLCRSEQVRNHIVDRFSLPGQVNLTLDVTPAGAGTIRVSTVTPDTYPWQGIYFKGVPVSIEAYPNPGYTFQQWEENAVISDTLNALFEDNLVTNSLLFRAIFEEIPVGVSETATSGYRLYPTPAAQVIFIACPDAISSRTVAYEISGNDGKILLSGILNGQQNATAVDISTLPGGQYYVRLKTDIDVVMKFVKYD